MLFITATLVDRVDMVVDVVVLGKAGRPAVVPAALKKNIWRKSSFLEQEKKK